jgi:dihydropyrimidine dehydrogenase (NAD+) subunit PreT
MTAQPETSISQMFEEITAPLSVTEASFEANRCLYCYDAPCSRACPTHIDVASFIRRIATGNLNGSARVIYEANPMGASCARVCPVEVMCEAACVKSTLMSRPIMIGRLQRYATDHVLKRQLQLFKPANPIGYSVGIIGSGPAGLSCATYLARLGYTVTIYEQKLSPGGLNSHGMAEYKMTKAVALSEIELIEALGVKFELGVSVGKEIEIELLEERHDLIFIACGLGASRNLSVEGEELSGVIDALSFIEKIKSGDTKQILGHGRVAVIGGGNTAIDAARQALRLGASDVTVLYRRSESDMSAYKHEYEDARREGIKFLWNTVALSFLPNGSRKVASIECKQTNQNSSSSNFQITCDMVIKAAGQERNSLSIKGVTYNPDGTVRIDPETFQTSSSRYFAGGDCVNGGKEAVDAVQDGKLAAQSMHKFLTGQDVKFAGGDR